MLWDLIQQVQLSEHKETTLSLERRVKKLEKELLATKESLLNLTMVLEAKFGEGLSSIPDFREESEKSQTIKAPIRNVRNHSFKTRNDRLQEQLQKAKFKKKK